MEGIITFLQANTGTFLVAALVCLILFFAFRSVFIKKSVGCNGKCGSCKGCH